MSIDIASDKSLTLTVPSLGFSCYVFLLYRHHTQNWILFVEQLVRSLFLQNFSSTTPNVQRDQDWHLFCRSVAVMFPSRRNVITPVEIELAYHHNDDNEENK